MKEPEKVHPERGLRQDNTLNSGRRGLPCLWIETETPVGFSHKKGVGTLGELGPLLWAARLVGGREKA